jgi:hypothetical protein
MRWLFKPSATTNPYFSGPSSSGWFAVMIAGLELTHARLKASPGVATISSLTNPFALGKSTA